MRRFILLSAIAVAAIVAWCWLWAAGSSPPVPGPAAPGGAVPTPPEPAIERSAVPGSEPPSDRVVGHVLTGVRAPATGAEVRLLQSVVPLAFGGQTDEAGRRLAASGGVDTIAMTRTGPDGEFAFGRRPDGPFWISASRETAPDVVAFAGPFESRTWIGAPVELTMPPVAGVAGVVEDAGGQPLAGCTVSVVPRGGEFIAAVAARRVLTGTDGTFHVTVDAAGSFDVVAVRPGSRPAAVAAIRPGGESLRLVMQSDEVVRILVCEADGEAPIAGAEVILFRSFDEETTAEERAVSAHDGSVAFAKGAADQVLVLAVRKEGYCAVVPGSDAHTGEPAWRAVACVRGAELPAKLLLRRAASVSGRVLESGIGYGVAGARVAAVFAGDFELRGVRWVTTTATDGSYRFDGLPAGCFVLAVMGERHCLCMPEIDAERQQRIDAGKEAPPFHLDLAAGEQREGLDLQMAPGAIVRGRVVDDVGAPVSGARVLWQTPFDQRLADLRGAEVAHAVFSDADGGFVLGNVRADATVEVVAEHSALLGKASLQVRAVAATAVELVLPRDGGVRGTLTQFDGRPAVGLRVLAVIDGANTVPDPRIRAGCREAEAVCAADGTFALGPLQPGAWHLWVDGDEEQALPADQATIHVPAGNFLRRDLVLGPAPLITGVVQDGSGNAVAHALVTAIREAQPAPLAPRLTGPDDEPLPSPPGPGTAGHQHAPPILCRTGVDGSFRFRCLEPGARYRLTFAAQQVTVRDGGEEVIEFAAVREQEVLHVEPGTRDVVLRLR